MLSGAVVFLCVVAQAVTESLNDRPIIGVLSQELDDEFEAEYPYNLTSYIAASYVKYLESSGSRVVPIWINQSPEYYASIVDRVNGILIPGGAASFNVTDGYAAAGWELFQLAKEKNDAGVHFPVWGTCLGFELLAVMSANQTDMREFCEVQNLPLPLVFRPDARKSRLYGEAPSNIMDILEKQDVTINFHHWCITEEALSEAGIDDEWHILSVNEYNGSEFISSFEHKEYPFYGVQFHPEKNAFEWKITNNNPHTAEAILVGQFYANFFVNEARKNNNSFFDEEEESKFLIYNHMVTTTGNNTPFEQTYFFSSESEQYEFITTTTTTTTTTTSTTTTPSTTTDEITTTSQTSTEASTDDESGEESYKSPTSPQKASSATQNTVTAFVLLLITLSSAIAVVPL